MKERLRGRLASGADPVSPFSPMQDLMQQFCLFTQLLVFTVTQPKVKKKKCLTE